MNKKKSSALSVTGGVILPESTRPDAIESFKRQKRKNLSIAEYYDGILRGDITIISRAITLIESVRQEHQDIAQALIERCLKHSGNSLRIGITGSPGVGKSSFIETLGTHVVKEGNKLAVLAIDPSSNRTGGSILGDKTRMESLTQREEVFIRPSPSAGTLGGVARKTRESIIVCEAAGFDTIFIETVGVGQSETAVHSMVDFFLLLMLPGSGDELQGIKRGIMELADAIAITKNDGTNIPKVKKAMNEFSNALHLFPPNESGWTTRVMSCSALESTGIEEIWNMIEAYANFSKENGYFLKRRKMQSRYWMHETIHQRLKDHFYSHPKLKDAINESELAVQQNKISSFIAAGSLIEQYFRLFKEDI